MKTKDKTYYTIAALLCVINGGVICPFFAVFDSNVGMFLPLGMMWTCIGLAFFVVGQGKTKKRKMSE
jgi:hypothetical protein